MKFFTSYFLLFVEVNILQAKSTHKPNFHGYSINCDPPWFGCLDGVCIPLIWVCDGSEDCTYGEDEYCAETVVSPKEEESSQPNLRKRSFSKGSKDRKSSVYDEAMTLINETQKALHKGSNFVSEYESERTTKIRKRNNEVSISDMNTSVETSQVTFPSTEGTAFLSTIEENINILPGIVGTVSTTVTGSESVPTTKGFTSTENNEIMNTTTSTPTSTPPATKENTEPTTTTTESNVTISTSTTKEAATTIPTTTTADPELVPTTKGFTSTEKEIEKMNTTTSTTTSTPIATKENTEPTTATKETTKDSETTSMPTTKEATTTMEKATTTTSKATATTKPAETSETPTTATMTTTEPCQTDILDAEIQILNDKVNTLLAVLNKIQEQLNETECSKPCSSTETNSTNSTKSPKPTLPPSTYTTPHPILEYGDLPVISKVTCPYYFRNMEGVCIYVQIYPPVSWFEASSLCDSQNGHLVYVKTKKFFEKLLKQLNFDRMRVYDFWIGATNEHTNGQWSWYDGSFVTSFDVWGFNLNANKAEILLDNHNPHQCGFLDGKLYSYLNGASCHEPKGFICQFGH